MAPYVTEAIWQSIEANKGSILAAKTYKKIMPHNEELALDFEN